jgi:hypothetical protein
VAKREAVPSPERLGDGTAERPAERAAAKHPRWWRRTGGRLLLLIIGLVALAAVVEAPRTWLALADPHGKSRCLGFIGKRLSSNGTPGRYSLSPRTPNQVYQLSFGDSREADFVTVEFDESGGTRRSGQTNRVLRTYISEFRRADGRKFHNPKSQIYTQAIIGNRGVVRLYTCFDPGSGRRIIPGTYLGTVTIDDRSLKEPVVVPIQVSLKYPDLGFPIVVTLIAALLATWLKALSDDETEDLPDWLAQRKNKVALFFGLGAVAAVYGGYLRSIDWGTSGLLDVGTLFAAAFAAHLAGLTAYQAGEISAKPKAVDRAAEERPTEPPGDKHERL